eukprot:6185433-Pleurochrysis_carterae.AAC.1
MAAWAGSHSRTAICACGAPLRFVWARSGLATFRAARLGCCAAALPLRHVEELRRETKSEHFPELATIVMCSDERKYISGMVYSIIGENNFSVPHAIELSTFPKVCKISESCEQV